LARVAALCSRSSGYGLSRQETGVRRRKPESSVTAKQASLESRTAKFHEQLGTGVQMQTMYLFAAPEKFPYSPEAYNLPRKRLLFAFFAHL